MHFKPKLTLFNIFYSTTFTLLFFLLVILLFITPIDAIYQIVHQSRRPFYKIIVIAGCYFLTVVVVLAIFVSRRYTVRNLIKDIPREYVPIKKLHLPKRVHARIRAGLGRSAIIAYESRPKAIVGVAARRRRRDDSNGPGGREEANMSEQQQEQQHRPIWGKINHNGFSPPDSKDLPNVEYFSIIKELPNLIEKKVLSLGLQRHHLHSHSYHDRYYHRDSDPPIGVTMMMEEEQQKEEETRRLLSRMPKMSLRAYISYLQKLGYVHRAVGEVFLRDYEKARFYSAGVNGVEEDEFRKLMKVFALLLRGMDELAQQRNNIGSSSSSGIVEYFTSTSTDYGSTDGGGGGGIEVDVEAGPSNSNRVAQWEGQGGRLGEDLRRTFTESTMRSGNSSAVEFPHRRRFHSDEVQGFEMEYLSPPSSRMRQRPSFGTFG